MESIASILSNILYKINHIGEGEYIRDELQKILECDILDLPREVNLLKIKLELFYYSYNKTKNVVLSKQRANDILENRLNKANSWVDASTRNTT